MCYLPLSSYSPHGSVRILFSFPQLPGLGLLVLAWVYFMELDSVSSVSGKPFCSGIPLYLMFPGLARQPVWICPGSPDRLALRPIQVFGLPPTFSVPGSFSSRGTGPARLSSQGAPLVPAWCGPAPEGSPPAPPERAPGLSLTAAAAGPFIPDAGAPPRRGQGGNAPAGAGSRPHPAPAASRRAGGAHRTPVRGGGEGVAGRCSGPEEAAGEGRGAGPGLALLTEGAAAGGAG